MIPAELLHGAIGFVAALIAHRIGIPLFPSSPGAPVQSASLRTMVRDVLLEVLRGLNQPQPTPDDELRQHLQAVVEKKP